MVARDQHGSHQEGLTIVAHPVPSQKPESNQLLQHKNQLLILIISCKVSNILGCIFEYGLYQ